MSAQAVPKPKAPATIRRAGASAPWRTVLCLITADLASLSTVYWAVVLIRYRLNGQYHLSSYLDAFPAVILFIAIFFAQDLYPCLLIHPAEELRRVFRSVTVVFLLISCSTFFWRNTEGYSRSIFLITWLWAAPAVLMGRKLTRKLCAGKTWWGAPAIVFGSGALAERVISHFENRRDLGIRVVGLLATRSPGPLLSQQTRALGNFEDGLHLPPIGIARYAILVMPEAPRADIMRMIEENCDGFRHVLLVPNLPGLCGLDIVCREVGGELGLELSQRLLSAPSALCKRFIDIAGSIMTLLLLSPLLLGIALLIKVTSRGPILFSHSRFGQDGKTFQAWKFRTMYRNGDRILAEHLAAHPSQLFEWQRDQKLRHDPRVTPIGKLLRRYSADELPQLVNVLQGDMSLVGPRPIVRSEIERYGEAYPLYKRVLPGLTGLWQVSGRNNTTYAERISYDKYYVRNWSVWLDAYILARTIKTVITGEGAY